MQPNIENLLIAVLDHDGDQRRYLKDLCADDSSLYRELSSLYEAACQAKGFLSSPPVVAHFQENLSGERLGAYRLLSKLGQGGMGTVYLAERADGQYRQKVAVKLISNHIDSLAAQRFRDERQILAGMNHQHIARLMDGGEHTDGRPYLVMELIEGKPIDSYCNEHDLTILERLAIFEQVCQAVQYAHDKGVVHRDLKPANLFVTEQGQVKLFDFGIAKPLNVPQNSQSRHMTPAYAAPEQIFGGVIGPYTDVYALGVILYELLTGQRPDYAIQPPGQLLQPALRRRWQCLDTVIQTALHYKPDQRYGSVQAFNKALQACVANPTQRRINRYRVGLVYGAITLATAAGLVAAVVLLEPFPPVPAPVAALTPAPVPPPIAHSTAGPVSTPLSAMPVVTANAPDNQPCPFNPKAAQLTSHVRCMLNRAHLLNEKSDPQALKVLDTLDHQLSGIVSIPRNLAKLHAIFYKEKAQALANSRKWLSAVENQKVYVRMLRRQKQAGMIKADALETLGDYLQKVNHLFNAGRAYRMSLRLWIKKLGTQTDGRKDILFFKLARLAHLNPSQANHSACYYFQKIRQPSNIPPVSVDFTKIRKKLSNSCHKNLARS